MINKKENFTDAYLNLIERYLVILMLIAEKNKNLFPGLFAELNENITVFYNLENKNISRLLTLILFHTQIVSP